MCSQSYFPAEPGWYVQLKTEQLQFLFAIMGKSQGKIRINASSVAVWKLF